MTMNFQTNYNYAQEAEKIANNPLNLMIMKKCIEHGVSPDADKWAISIKNIVTEEMLGETGGITGAIAALPHKLLCQKADLLNKRYVVLAHESDAIYFMFILDKKDKPIAWFFENN